jgi:hypothetical protein
MRMNPPVLLLFLTAALDAAAAPAPSTPDAASLKRLSARLAPVELAVDISRLPPSERAADRSGPAASRCCGS